MREIKFRGKRADIDWKYGYLTIIEGTRGNDFNTRVAIKPFDEKYITYGVDPESVGEFTGLKDKNGVEIYEGDRVGFWSNHHDISGVVTWNEIDGCWAMDWEQDEVKRVRKEAQMPHMPGNLNCVGSPWVVLGNIYEAGEAARGCNE